MSEAKIKAVGYIKSEDVFAYAVKSNKLETVLTEIWKVTRLYDKCDFKRCYKINNMYVVMYSFEHVVIDSDLKMIVTKNQEMFDEMLSLNFEE